MPVFAKGLEKIDPNNTQKSLIQMANHIKYIQEQLEYTLSNLDSSNIREIKTDETDITGSTGSTILSSDEISLEGKSGETFKAGIDKATNRFGFEVKGKNGIQYIYINANGDMVITKNATLSIDCGTW